MQHAQEPSVRAQIIERRTYLRPTNIEGTEFETFPESVDRVIGHQRWLWERAIAGMTKGADDEWIMAKLDMVQELELEELKGLLLQRKVTLSGRTRWLGGTSVAKKREASQFNCAFLEVRTVYDIVDVLWLLLQGCGVGFRPVIGTLNGFSHKIAALDIIRSERTPEQFAAGDRGNDHNVETFDSETGVWTIQVGDSAEAWAKSIGKIMAGKRKTKKLVLDFTQIRAGGIRLSGYGWISSGDEKIAEAYEAIFEIMNAAAGKMLTRMNILDLVNWLGTVLSSRRSAEICLMEHGEPEWEEFAVSKLNHFERGEPQRGQSNNTILFTRTPDRTELESFFKLMEKAGGSEPGIANSAAAQRRAPWFKGANPCYEILLGDRSFCNLVETVLWRFNGDFDGLLRAHYLLARANYRQTCVHLDDGILQRSWHELNEFLRLCGVGVTGVVAWERCDNDVAWRLLRQEAKDGTNNMADELGLPRSKADTTIKPSGTNSKTLSTTEQECPEGVHAPLGRYIFNNVGMSEHDPLIPLLREADYHIFENPYDRSSLVVRLPADFGDLDAFEDIKGIPVNTESAIKQLNRYLLVMRNYVDHNCSVTISYSKGEVPGIIDWLLENWDDYVAVSFLYRNDPFKTAEDLGYPYLPQQVVDKQTFDTYVRSLKPVNLDNSAQTDMEIDDLDECATGSCPIR